jgi:CRP-like cAMP-binding protein
MLNLQSTLRNNRWFRDLSQETLAALAAGSVVRRLGHGEQWVSRSETAAGIAIILAGGLRSIAVTEDGRECVFSIMREGDVWGIVSSIDALENPNDVYTHGPTTLLVIERQAVQRALATCLDFNRCLLDILTHRIRMANAVIEDRALKPIEVRLARLLRSLQPAEYSSSGNLSVAVSQDILARMLGCTRPTVNRQLKHFERQGYIRLDYGKVALIDVERIEALSGGDDLLYF